MTDLLIIIATFAILLIGGRIISNIRYNRRFDEEEARKGNIIKMETELGLPTSYPQDRTVIYNPTALQLNVNTPLLAPGDKLTLRCGWTGCDYEIVTEVSEYLILEGNNIPGGDQLIRHQADHAHWTANVSHSGWYR